jgi:sugar O-acyltransferase (sialic acid O-acetyltransferase NeuD family)
MGSQERDVVIYGAGGFGREVGWLIRQCSESGWSATVRCFIDDNLANHGKLINNVPVFSLQQAADHFGGAFVVGGVGAPQTRATLIQRALAAGFKPITVIHPRVECSEYVTIGTGTLICAGNILTIDIVLGEQVQINLDCTIGHDVQLGDYTTLAPGVHVSGCVITGKRVYIGTGAVIINGTPDKPIIIEDDAVIGAGACVTKSVPAGITVVGVPARPLVR